jgi:hypothetical protein
VDALIDLPALEAAGQPKNAGQLEMDKWRPSVDEADNYVSAGARTRPAKAAESAVDGVSRV